MQHKDENLLESIYSYLEDTAMSGGRTPSMAEIGDRFKVSKSTAYNYVMSLKRSGRVEYDGESVLTLKTRKIGPSVMVPVFLSSIPCGPLESLDSSVDGYVSLPTALFPGDDLFIVRACGDSMTDAGIDEGDLVVMSKKDEAKEGDVVAALDGDGNNTLKRLKKVKGRYVLHPENAKYRDIKVEHLEVQGVAKFIIKAV